MNALKNSFFIRFILGICTFFANAYKNSKLKKAFNAVGRTVKASLTYKILKKYADKKPFYESSLIHKLIKKILYFIDIPMKAINKGILCAVKGSKVCGGISEIYSKGKSVQALCVFAMGIALVFALKGSAAGIGIFVIMLVLALIGSFNAVFKNCFVYRFICWLVKS